jgi:hypothetical protein
MDSVLKWGTLAFTAGAGASAAFAPVFPNYTSVLAATAASCSLIAGLFTHPPWARPVGDGSIPDTTLATARQPATPVAPVQRPAA